MNEPCPFVRHVLTSGIPCLFLYHCHPQTATCDKSSVSLQVLWARTSCQAQPGSASPATLDPEVTRVGDGAWVPRCPGQLPRTAGASEQCSLSPSGKQCPIAVCIPVSGASGQAQPTLRRGLLGAGPVGTILEAARHSHPWFFLLYVRNLSKKITSIFIFLRKHVDVHVQRKTAGAGDQKGAVGKQSQGLLRVCFGRRPWLPDYVCRMLV